MAPAQTTPPTSISPDNFLSSLGRTLAIVGLITIFTLAITAIVKILTNYVINRLRRLFSRPAVRPEAGQLADNYVDKIVGEWDPPEPEEIDEERQPAAPEEIHEEEFSNFNLSSLAIE